MFAAKIVVRQNLLSKTAVSNIFVCKSVLLRMVLFPELSSYFLKF
ncbi:hypothetical protein Plano_1517 [Planococcus sp. PAMC 21323]|nr:hypothetical protein Plano_1517 [Planococcus sp. PAMC 21323]